jgi:hypothetical protein
VERPVLAALDPEVGPRRREADQDLLVGRFLGPDPHAGTLLGHERAEAETQGIESRAGHRGDLQHVLPVGGQTCTDEFRHGLPVREVELVQHDELGSLEQRRIVTLQLPTEQREIGDRVPIGCARCRVKHVQQHEAAFDVTQEPVPEAPALGRTFDQAWHVGQDDVDGGAVGAVPAAHHPEVGGQGREGPCLDARPGRRQAGHQRGLPHRRETDQPDVGDQLELDRQAVLLHPLTALAEAREAPMAVHEGGVAPPSPAALGDDGPLSLTHQVGDHRPGAVVADHRADRHRDDGVPPPLTGAVHPGSVATVTSTPVRGPSQVEQRGHVPIGDEHDVAAGAAITPVGPSPGDVRFPSEGHGAIATVTAAHVHRALIDEAGGLHGGSEISGRRGG